MMAAFSAAMASTVSPRMAVWSSPTPVIAATLGDTTLVASQRPPRPTSSTAIRMPSLAEEPERGRGEQLELGEPGGGPDTLRPSQGAGGIERRADRESEVRIAYHGSVDLDTLGIALQLGARVQPRRDALGAEQRGGSARGRALAVRAGDLHGGIGVLQGSRVLHRAPSCHRARG